MVQRSRKKDGTIVNTEATITDLGTLVIIDDPEEEDEMDTMKRGCDPKCPTPLCCDLC